MRSLVTCDSAYGNTAKVAESIGAALRTFGSVSVKQVGEVAQDDLKGLDLLIIGSPTQGGRPTESTRQFIDSLPQELLPRMRIAIFDTRLEETKQKLPLRVLMKTIGYAAPKMAESIQRKGGTVSPQPEGFVVNDKEGPLKVGELDRAGAWAAQLATASS